MTFDIIPFPLIDSLLNSLMNPLDCRLVREYRKPNPVSLVLEDLHHASIAQLGADGRQALERGVA